MKRIAITILALVAIIITVTSRSEEQATVSNVRATETAISTTVGITLDEEVTPVKSTVSPEYTKVERKPIREVTTYTIATEVEPKPEIKQTAVTTKPIVAVTTLTEETTQSVATTPAETTATEVSTKPIDTTAKITTTESEITDSPESEDNIPEYKPSIGGDNPFDNPNDITEINDRPV